MTERPGFRFDVHEALARIRIEAAGAEGTATPFPTAKARARATERRDEPARLLAFPAKGQSERGLT